MPSEKRLVKSLVYFVWNLIISLFSNFTLLCPVRSSFRDKIDENAHFREPTTSKAKNELFKMEKEYTYTKECQDRFIRTMKRGF